jgi:hypothetical protein
MKASMCAGREKGARRRARVQSLMVSGEYADDDQSLHEA